MTIPRPLRIVALLVGGAILPQLTRAPYDYVLNLSLIYAIAVIGLGILLGMAGQLSLAQAAFLGISAYTSALLTTQLGWGFWPALAAAVAVSALVGLIVGYPALRLTGHYLALATIGFGVIVQIVLNNWKEVTNGADGITGLLPPSLGPIHFDTYRSYYYLVYAFLIVCAYIALRIKQTRVGRALEAIRENEIAAQSLGIDVARYKLVAFVLASTFAGLAGTLFAFNLKFVSPDTYSFDFSVLFLELLVIGGASTVTGAILGAIVLTFLPEWLRPLKDIYIMVYGAALIAMVIFFPQGIAGMLSSLYARRGGAPPPAPENVGVGVAQLDAAT